MTTSTGRRRVKRLLATAVTGILLADLAVVALTQPQVTAHPVDGPALSAADHHGQALLDGVGDFEDIARSQRRIDDRAGERDPSGRSGAGGRVVVHRAGGRRIRLGSAYALLHRTGVLGIEPTIGVLRDGSVIVQGMGPDAEYSVIMRSRDAGRTFTDVTPRTAGRPTHAQSQDPYLYVEPRTGRVFTTDYAGCGLLSHSDNGGQSWTTDPPICSALTDHQTIFGGPPATSRPTGYPHVVYYCAATLLALNVSSTSSGCEKSTDGGQTFAPTGGLAFTPRPQYDDEGAPAGICTGLVGHGTVGPDGSVYLPKTCERPLLSISRDEGRTWEVVTIPTTLGVNTGAAGLPDHEAAVGVDARGVVYYTWMGRDRLPYLVTSRDRGRTWSTPLMVAAPGINEANIPSLAVTPGGRLAIAYMGTTTSPGRPFINDSCGLCPNLTAPYAETTWNGYITVSDNPLSPNPTFQSVSINAPADPLTVGQCGPFRCQQQFDFDDVQFGPDGTPWAVFSDGCDSDAALVCESLGEAVVGRIAGLPRHG